VIDRIKAMAGSVTEAVGQQGQATREIAMSIGQAASGAQTAGANASNVRAAAGRAGDAAGQVLAATDDLTGLADRLQAEVRGFVDRVRRG
jgi:methyl-accepting chemotaxis protein